MPPSRLTAEDLHARICELTGVSDPDAARRIGRAVTSVLLEQLSMHDRSWLASELPPGWVPESAYAQLPAQDALEDFYARVAAREAIEPGFAREHAQSCCRALAEALCDEARLHLVSRLPDELARLLELPEPARSSRFPGPRHAQRPRTTLSEGRPGSRHPISDGTPRGAQQDSVVRSENPHRDTKLSTSAGTTQEREDETLSRSHAK